MLDSERMSNTKTFSPSGANMLKSYNYQGSKDHIGTSMILITKAFDKKIICAVWYTTPEVMGMDVVDHLKAKHESAGGEGSFSKRLPGFIWIGYDPTYICRGEKAIRKAAWICTPRSASARQGLDYVELPYAHLHIAELLVYEESTRKLKVKLGIFQRTIKLDTTAEQNPATTATPTHRHTPFVLGTVPHVLCCAVMTAHTTLSRSRLGRS